MANHEQAGPHATDRVSYARVTLWLIVGLTLLRALGILISPLNLGPDEAQYWRWGQALDWGYYSKPPLIAWLIGASTHLLGDAEWAVRLPAPFLHAAAAISLFVLGREMYDERTGSVAAIGYVLMPGIILSSGIMTTDGILLPIVTFTLLVLWRFRTNNTSWQYAALLGALIGLGFLAKYAMVYVLIGIGLACWIDTDTRKAILSSRGLLTGLVALACLAPHLIWSAENAFTTLAHTADNANWQGALFNPENGVTFLVDQMGVVGPIAFVVLTAAIIGTLRRKHGHPTDMWLLCFVLPALALIMVQAVTSRAHANWAAMAYAAGCLLIARFFVFERPWPQRGWQIAAGLVFTGALFTPDMALLPRVCLAIGLALGILSFGKLNAWRRMGLFWANITLNGMVAAIFMTLAIGPVSWSESTGFANAFKRTRGWQASVTELAKALDDHGAIALMVDERENWHGIDYYGRDGLIPVPVYTWQRNPAPKSHAETFSLPEGTQGPVLIAAKSQLLDDRIGADFETVERAGLIEVPLGGGKIRQFNLYIATGHTPVQRDENWILAKR